MIVSIGMNTWELPLAIASSMAMNMLVVVFDRGEDHHEKIRDMVGRFKLNLNQTGFLIIPGHFGKSVKENWPERDREIAALADVFLPVSIRPQGTLEKLLDLSPEKIVGDFRVSYRKTSRPRPKYDIGPGRNNRPYENVLIHFTRTTPGPWPDETEFDFYRAIIVSRNEYCRSARDTLLHILGTGIIFAGTRNIRDGHRVVGFTQLSPENLPGLFRYRPRLVNPYFEPYGLGLSIPAAVRAGIRPVRYGLPQIYSALAAEDRPFFQNEGGDGGRWLAEQEWRHLGDFHFEDIPHDELRVFVPDSNEAEFFRKQTGLRVEPLFDK